MNAPQTQRGKIIWLNAVFLMGTPLAAVILVPWYLWNHDFTGAHLAGLTTLWITTGIAITAGYHRLFSHRSFQASAPVRLAFAIFGAGTWQNSIIEWCADHRYHHRDVDTDGDPYNIQKGMFYAHIGWVMQVGLRHNDTANVDDLRRDPICRWQHKYYWPISIAFNLGIPGLLGWWTGDVVGMLLFAGLVRVVLVHHFTFCINSLAHVWGRQPYSKNNSSRDNWAISLISFGEGYHNYHHAFQTDYRNGPRWYNYDPSKWLIWSMARTGLVAKLQRAPAERIARVRFDEGRRRLTERVASWGDVVDEQFDAAEKQVATMRQALHDQLSAAEAKLEAALAEVRAVRQVWAEQHKPHGVSLRRARRRVNRALKDWERLVQDYIQLHTPQPALA